MFVEFRISTLERFNGHFSKQNDDVIIYNIPSFVLVLKRFLSIFLFEHYFRYRTVAKHCHIVENVLLTVFSKSGGCEAILPHF